jgi:hypothetical protein
MSDRIVERQSDPVPRLRRLTMQVRVLAVVLAIILVAKLAYIALIGGWKVALAAGGIIVLLFGAWRWIEAAVGSARMRRFISRGRFTLPRKEGAPISGSIDSWLLLKDGFKAVGVDRNAGLIWFFPSPRTALAYKVASLCRIEAGERKTWLGGRIRTVRLSDSLVGPWTEFIVREGDVDCFVRSLSETSPNARIRTSRR